MCVLKDRKNMLVKVEFASFAVDPAENSPLIILKETGGNRMVPIPIGPLEAGAIAIETLKLMPLRPLTIDMAKSILEKLGGTLVRVIFHLSPSQCLMARLEISAGGGMHHLESKPCDAIALALRCRAPILVREAVFEKFSPKNSASEQEKLRSHIAALDTLEFGTVYLE